MCLHYQVAIPRYFVVVGETCPCICHPSGWLRTSALTCRWISLVGVKWSCLLIDKQSFPPRSTRRVRPSTRTTPRSSSRFVPRFYLYPCHCHVQLVPELSHFLTFKKVAACSDNAKIIFKVRPPHIHTGRSDMCVSLSLYPCPCHVQSVPE